MNARIEDLKRQLRQLDELAASGTLPADQAASARAKLEQELVSQVMDSGASTTAGSGTPAAAPIPAAPAAAAARPSRRLLAGLSVFVLAVAAAGYAVYGTPGAWRGVPVAQSEDEAGAGHGSAAAQIEDMVAKLEQRMKTQPDDAEGWSMLGRSYSALGRYPEAVTAFKRVSTLKPKDAQALADQADAVAMAAGRKLAGEPAQLIARALELDPKNLKALALAGTIAFDASDFPKAAQLWSAAVAVAEPGSELERNLQSGVAEARSRAGLPPAAAAASGPVATSAAATAASLAGQVDIAAALKAKASPEDTLFVFARAVEGPRVPLAILRKQVKDLPLTFTLDDSMAMNPAMRLSTATQVIVGARISKSGNAIAQPGDLQGFTKAVAVGASGLKIEIAEEVK
ncbi:tetratricopeptide repeat protein [Rhizobacter sp. AJA081-3]|uniref:tetratricopeptide repeat protein n=1 Tax=Rhizobacter sp. AJA081-3 TaxID=2753607 RepID=UPI001ADFA91B|nr:tetratricopeptide repeat protein [Rhizobacter sp. AJA081-3]QTN23155.1 tetratricopeptide repeat protein [Rhizobacter sp. AJA081-3]